MRLEQSAGHEAVSHSGSAEGFIGRMAEKLGATARAATIFGDPVERDGVTVIPVARARWVSAAAQASGVMRTEPAAAAEPRSPPWDSSN